ncbi:DUF6290 family protein [Helicobacter marmotae]|uniref:CopG family transcriptional regulator n=1 Tax=Helicobacter marmotae TaxID=152490 RepID=A0A3D8I699_9HELI|nr:DUF6290 family protein [Helicobacter marmotae]RDU60679.1 hypothetical protein CQA63_01490 [Helicobacter marmotae]
MSITLDLPNNIEKLYKKFAKEQNTTQKELMQKALLAYIEELEDLSIAYEGRKERINGESGKAANEFYKELGI